MSFIYFKVSDKENSKIFGKIYMFLHWHQRMAERNEQVPVRAFHSSGKPLQKLLKVFVRDFSIFPIKYLYIGRIKKKINFLEIFSAVL